MKIVAISGTYRRGQTTDTAVDLALKATADKGAQIQKIHLLDKSIAFCKNCRNCMQTERDPPGACSIHDDMAAILADLQQAEGYIFASPVNFYTVTAIMKRFVERLACFGYWPWGTPAPRYRIVPPNKKALLIVSGACPTWIGRMVYKNPFSILASAARCVGAKTVQKLYLGGCADSPNFQLSEKQKMLCLLGGQRLAQ